MRKYSEPLMAAVDQGVSSGTNFGLMVIAVRTLSPSAFGVFSIIFAVYVLLAGLSQGVASAPFTIRYGASTEPERLKAQAGPYGAAAAIGFASMALIAATAVFVPIHREALWILAVAMPALLVQDCYRFVCVAGGRPTAALSNDLIWAAVQTVVILSAIALHGMSLGAIVLAWALGATVAAAAGCLEAHVLPNFKTGFTWVRNQLDLSARYGVEALVIRGWAPISQGIIAVAIGLAALGDLRAAQVIFSVFNFVFVGALFALVPWIVRQVPSGRWIGVACAISTGLGLLVILWAGVVILNPASIVAFVFGGSYGHAYPLLIAVAVQMMAIAASLGPQAVLRASGSARLTVRLQVANAAILVAASAVAVFHLSVAAIAWSLALGSVVATVAWWLAVAFSAKSAAFGSAHAARQGSQDAVTVGTGL